MKIKYLHCRYCGRPWNPPDEVNVNQAYCAICSGERKNRADKMHMLDKRKVIQIGSYVLLSFPYYEEKVTPLCEDWHLANKFSGRKKPRR